METNNLLLRKRGWFDELYTPDYAIVPLKRYIEFNQFKTIWCPFDGEESNYVKIFKEGGLEVIYGHIEDGLDFFEYEPPHYDCIISNPPFSSKDKILARLYTLNKPFAMLLPIVSLEGIKRGRLFRENGVEVMVLDKRINFMEEKNSASYFNTSYFCNKFLGRQLVFEEINKKGQ